MPRADGTLWSAAMASMELGSIVLRLRQGDHVGVLKKTVKVGVELVDEDSAVKDSTSGKSPSL